MTFIAVRHTAPLVQPGVCYGKSDLALPGSFPADSRRVIEKLGGVKIGSIYTSPLIRCRRLAEEIAGTEQVIIAPLLREMDFGSWELCRWDKINDETSQRWFKDYIHTPAPGGESFIDVLARVNDFLNGLSIQKNGAAVCVTHSGVIRCMAHILCGIPLEETFGLEIGFGSVTAFLGKDMVSI